MTHNDAFNNKKRNKNAKIFKNNIYCLVKPRSSHQKGVLQNSHSTLKIQKITMKESIFQKCHKLQACNFTKDKVLHMYLSNIFTTFVKYIYCRSFLEQFSVAGVSDFQGVRFWGSILQGQSFWGPSPCLRLCPEIFKRPFDHLPSWIKTLYVTVITSHDTVLTLKT